MPSFDAQLAPVAHYPALAPSNISDEWPPVSSTKV